MRPDPVEILLEELVFGILRRTVDVAAGRAGLVGPEDEAAVLLAHVPGRIRLAQHAHLGQAEALALEHRRMRLGHDVLVLDRDDRDVEPDHGAGAAREIAGRRDDVLAQDVATVGLDEPLAGRRALDGRHARLAVDLGAAAARAFREGLRQIRRLDVAVARMPDGADHAIRLAERPELLDLCGRQHLDVDANGLGDALVGHELVEAVAGAGEADVRDLLEADRLAGLRFEGLVERDRVFVDLADRVAHVEERQKARRMPGRAGGELLALDEHDVAPALLGEMIERADADDPAADDDHPSLRSHDPPLACPCPFIGRLRLSPQGARAEIAPFARPIA